MMPIEEVHLEWNKKPIKAALEEFILPFFKILLYIMAGISCVSILIAVGILFVLFDQGSGSDLAAIAALAVICCVLVLALWSYMSKVILHMFVDILNSDKLTGSSLLSLGFAIGVILYIGGVYVASSLAIGAIAHLSSQWFIVVAPLVVLSIALLPIAVFWLCINCGDDIKEKIQHVLNPLETVKDSYAVSIGSEKGVVGTEKNIAAWRGLSKIFMCIGLGLLVGYYGVAALLVGNVNVFSNINNMVQEFILPLLILGGVLFALSLIFEVVAIVVINNSDVKFAGDENNLKKGKFCEYSKLAFVFHFLAIGCFAVPAVDFFGLLSSSHTLFTPSIAYPISFGIGGLLLIVVASSLAYQAHSTFANNAVDGVACTVSVSDSVSDSVAHGDPVPVAACDPLVAVRADGLQ